MRAASSKSLTPHTQRPSASRHVPKFSRWMSPTHSAAGASESPGRSPRWAPRPPVVGRAQEHEGTFSHPAVLGEKVVLDHGALGAKPAFIGFGIFQNLQNMPPDAAMNRPVFALRLRLSIGASHRNAWSNGAFVRRWRFERAVRSISSRACSI